MDVPTFRAEFPAFANATAVPDTLITAKLNAAAQEIDLQLFGANYDEAQGFLAAHYLASEPFGQNARMVNKDGTTIYWAMFERRRNFAAIGFRNT